ncbi:MAG TPA: hypothetical protein VNE39_18435, partial [Planctomycetota bacterium]|nr:hypothetical protein [Planctomycetota bacterium]
LDALSVAPAEPLPDPYQDLSTYAEVDPDGDLTIGEAGNVRCTFDTMLRSVAAYLTKDFGAGHFGNYTHDFDCFVSATSSFTAHADLWGVSNAAGTFADRATGQTVYWYYSGTGSIQYLNLREMSTGASDAYVATLSTPYYCTAIRSGTDGSCEIYDDPGRLLGDLLDTLIVTVAATTYRYHIACASREATGTATITGYVENHDLHEAAAWQLTVTESLALGDAAAKAVGKPLAESLGLSEATGKGIGKPLAEALACADAAAKGVGKPVAESLGLSEATGKGVAKPVAESLGLSDALAKAIAKAAAEALACADAAGKGVGKPVAESLGLGDAAGKAVRKSLAETLGLLDAVVKAASLSVSETLGLLDAAAKTAAITLAESLGLSDSASRQLVLEIVGLVRAVFAARILRSGQRQERQATTTTVRRVRPII